MAIIQGDTEMTNDNTTKPIRKNYTFRQDTYDALLRVQRHLGVSSETAALETLIHRAAREVERRSTYMDRKVVALQEDDGTVWISKGGEILTEAFFAGDDSDEEMRAAGYIQATNLYATLKSELLDVDDLWVQL